MASPIHYPVDDKDLDDAALWAIIDSAAASLSSTSKSRKPLALKYTNIKSPTPISISNPSPPTKFFKNPRNHNSPENNIRILADGDVLQEHWAHPRPQKIARSCVSEMSETSPLVVVKHVQRTPTTPSYPSPETGRFSVKEYSPACESSPSNCRQSDERENMRHSLAGQFPSVSLFKEYQNAAMAILEKSDYTTISGSPFIKKSGWRKISFYFNLSYEIKDKTIEFDENRNVQRAEFVVRAYMQGGRFSDGWGSCERREKRFLKPNHDIPSTAETRAKNKACQDLLGIGEYRPGASRAQQ
uniref:Peptide transporter family protein n=1 Tax=Davidia involucrata TaxID=16924 RepID=A0A5B7BE18_DAVIN